MTSAAMHQLWHSWRQVTSTPLESTVIMMFGTVTGTIVMLYAFKLLLALLPRKVGRAVTAVSHGLPTLKQEISLSGHGISYPHAQLQWRCRSCLRAQSQATASK